MPQDKPVNLNVERARKEGDATLLTVSDCLEGALADAEGYGWSKAVLMFYREKDGIFDIDMRSAGCMTLEARGILFSWIREEIRSD